MPSTISSSLSRLWPSSTVITPSLPTFAMASAMILPMDSSALAEMVPTWAISLGSEQGLEIFLIASTAATTALSIPRLRSIGFMPAATDFRPSRSIAWASTVAVVVPSPATSEVLLATSFTICAPMFSYLALSSVSFATLTPSLVTVGAPKDFSSTTLRPLGPRVTFTASARMLTPRSIRVRAESPKITSLAAIVSSLVKLLLDHAHDVFFAHHEQFFVVDLHLGAGIFAEENLVADLDVERAHLAVFQDLAVADGHYLTLDRLLLDGIGDNDAARGFALFFDAAHDHTVMKGTNFHCGFSFCSGFGTHYDSSFVSASVSRMP